MNKEELAIACLLYVSEQENVTPQNLLWGLVPIENRSMLSDSSPNEKAEQAARPGS